MKREYEEIVKNEVQRAISADEDAIYVDNVKAYTLEEKVKNRYTGQDDDPDERPMRSIEERIDVADNRKEDWSLRHVYVLAALAAACARAPAKQEAVVPLPTVRPAVSTVPADPVDLPRASDFDRVVTVFTVDIQKDGSLSANGRPAKDAADLAGLARAAARKNPGLRAVIRADRSVA